MKLSDYVVQFTKNITDSVFLVSGGGIMHLVDSLGKSGLEYVCCHHEQAAAIAAEGYGRIKNTPGVAFVTTGPGGTNALTGIAGAWLDSIPMFVIAGQVKCKDISPIENGVPVVRQIGLQELNVIDMVRPIVKYAVTVRDEKEIRYHLEKAVYLATHGRPGPVFIEIPLDIQALEIEPQKLSSFEPTEIEKTPAISTAIMEQVMELLRNAKKPLLMAGNGIRFAGGEKTLWKVLEKLQINVVTPIFTADDLVTFEYPYYLGRQGMPGNKTANYAIDNCDLLLVIGERLQITQTSWEAEKFAAHAKKIMVDIDKNELTKKTISIDVPIHGDAKEFLEALDKLDIKLNRWNVPVEPIDPDKYTVKGDYVNVYRFIEVFNKMSVKMDVVTADGMASLVPHQALKIHCGQRFLTNAGLGHMGSGLPMAVGAVVANGKKPVICCEGDGSLMMNIQELETIRGNNLPVKLFIFNNNGYYSIRNTHTRFFNKIVAADPTSGVTIPDFSKLISAWGFTFVRINNDTELDKLSSVIDHQGPIVCELMLDPEQPMIEKWLAGTLTDKQVV